MKRDLKLILKSKLPEHSKYVGEYAELIGNAYHGFELKFTTGEFKGETVNETHLYYKDARS